MLEGLSSSDMVNVNQKMTTDLSDIHFPLKKITVTPFDKPWITEELKKIKRSRQRVYRKEGRSSHYLKIKEEYQMENVAVLIQQSGSWEKDSLNQLLLQKPLTSQSLTI